jgi:hypothetical protein
MMASWHQDAMLNESGVIPDRRQHGGIAEKARHAPECLTNPGSAG